MTFHFIENCKLYNYSNDITVSHADKHLKMLIDELFVDSLRLTQWFADNQMKANPVKLKAIAVGKHIHNEDVSFSLRMIAQYHMLTKL